MATQGDAAATLAALVAPRTVALIGASDNEKKLTARPQRFMTRHGFRGSIYPVNPGRESVGGLPAFESVEAIPDTVDHAYVLIDADGAIEAVEACVRKGVKVVSLLADGFAESGPAGGARQTRLLQRVEGSGVLLIGPNSTGVVDVRNGFSCTTNAAFATETLPAGRVAMISQSGSLIGTALSRGEVRGLGFSTLVSVGNEAQSGVGEIGQLLVEDEGIDGFMLFLETIRRPEAVARFVRRAHALGKPVVAYLIGRSEEGRALSVSHTGAMAGGTEAMAAFLRHHGVARVETFDALLEAPPLLRMAPRLLRRPKNVTVVTTTGGGGAMVIDQLGARGVAIGGPSPEVRAALEGSGIHIGAGKLVDVTLAGTNYVTMKAVLSQVMRSPEAGVVLVAIGSSAQFNPELSVKPIVDAAAELGPEAAPVVAFPLPEAQESLRLLNRSGVPAFRSVESCAESVALLFGERAPEPLAKVGRPNTAMLDAAGSAAATLNEECAGRLFRALGLVGPAQFVVGPKEPLPALLPIAFPCVAKALSSDLAHKSDVGAVRVNIADRLSLEQAMSAIRESVARLAPDAHIEGILIQEMRRGVGEVLVGVTRDPVIGPIITVGIGGTLAEIYLDFSVRPAPVAPSVARQMIDEVRGAVVLKGYRGSAVGDLEALADFISQFSALALLDEVEEAEANPVLVCAKGEGVIFLDAFVRLGSKGMSVQTDSGI